MKFLVLAAVVAVCAAVLFVAADGDVAMLAAGPRMI